MNDRRHPFRKGPVFNHDVDPRWADAEAVKKAPILGPSLGDPTRWGGEVTKSFPTIAQGENWSDQFLQATTRDTFSRSWSLVGTLYMTTTAWSQVSAWPPAAPPYFVMLEILQGVGQKTITQELLLAPGSPAAFTAAPYGLCWQQSAEFGGPYAPRVEPSGTIQGRSFAAIGALIGHNISVRMHLVNFSLAGNESARLEALLTPYDAGAGV